MELNNVDFKIGIDGGNLDPKFKGLNWIRLIILKTHQKK